MEIIPAFGRVELDDGESLEIASERTDDGIDIVVRYPDQFGYPLTLRLSPSQAADVSRTLVLVLEASGFCEHGIVVGDYCLECHEAYEVECGLDHD